MGGYEKEGRIKTGGREEEEHNVTRSGESRRLSISHLVGGADIRPTVAIWYLLPGDEAADPTQIGALLFNA